MTVALDRALAKAKRKTPTETAVPLLVAHCRLMRLPAPQLEFRFHVTRKWRFDCCWPDRLIALECDGGGFVSGRHGRGVGIEKDSEKLAEAAIAGFRVIRVTPKQIKNGQALAWLERLLRQESPCL